MPEQPLQLSATGNTLEEFKSSHPVTRVIDTYKDQLEELFLIRNPSSRFTGKDEKAWEEFLHSHLQGKSIEEAGGWFYFPWNKTLVHYLEENLHQELRTARNKNIITAEEQNKLYNATIGITGLSVGSHAALTIAMMGMAKNLKLADPDTISGSNLNRIRYDFTIVGENKCRVAARTIYQINPYANLTQYEEGITPDNIARFFDDDPKPAILVEELDNLEMKIRLRVEAKKRGIPVIMATDNGDNVIVDVERYDQEPDLPLFHGAAGNLTLEEFQNFPPQELPKLATKIAGPSVVVPRMLSSLLEVGKTLYSWPQLGDAATLSGVAVAYVVKRIILGAPVKSGKYEVNLDAIFDPNYNNPNVKSQREEARAKYLKQLGFE
ncbi:hypothetical protein D6779_07440 [Candidatus Parcubacteria bacterium]|nr:MAG: hypothetical protein D6779_07440 [Candidatus Parcubacteria bacterium]